MIWLCKPFRLTVVMSKKVQFKVTLTSDKAQPYRVINVPEEAPFTAVLQYAQTNVRQSEMPTTNRFAAEEFGIQSADSMAATTKVATTYLLKWWSGMAVVTER